MGPHPDFSMVDALKMGIVERPPDWCLVHLVGHDGVPVKRRPTGGGPNTPAPILKVNEEPSVGSDGLS